MINLFFIIFFTVQIVVQFLTWLYWLQVKEYRFDRFLVFLKSNEGKKELLLIPLIIRLFTLSLSIFVSPIFLFLYLIEVVIIGGYFSLVVIKKRMRKPIFTQRVKRIIIISIIFTVLLLLVLNSDIWMGFAELGFIIGPLLGIYLTNFSVNKTKEKEMKAAGEKLAKYKPYVICITGSYGKTTTKDFLTQLLSSKYPVLSTFKNQNTHFGIIRRINNDLQKKHKYFVAEVGAYKKGEILKIASILKPSMAFITGIEAQHLDLFGSFDNLLEAKFELIEALRKKGIALFNLSGKNVSLLQAKAERLDKGMKIYTYGLGDKKNLNARSEILRTSKNGIVFNLVIGKTKKEISTNIAARGLIENLTGAILASRTFGVEWNKIINKCKNLELPEGTLNIFKSKNGVTIIDDSYNASVSGFITAIDVLNTMKGNKKYVATTGVIEMGKESYMAHRKIGAILEKSADMILLRNGDFAKPITTVLTDKTKLQVINDLNKMLNYLRSNLNKGDVLLIEGKLPQITQYFKNL